MAAVAVATVQNKLFKNVAEILLEAQAAGSLIFERLGGAKKEEGEETPLQFPGLGWNFAGSGDGGSSWASCFYKLFWGLLCCPLGGQSLLGYLDWGGKLNKMNE